MDSPLAVVVMKRVEAYKNVIPQFRNSESTLSIVLSAYSKLALVQIHRTSVTDHSYFASSCCVSPSCRKLNVCTKKRAQTRRGNVIFD